MNWLIVVFFVGIDADGMQETYVFSKPTFETKNECIRAANDPNQIQMFVKKLVFDVGNKHIDKVVCSTEDQIKNAIILSNEGIST